MIDAIDRFLNSAWPPDGFASELTRRSSSLTLGSVRRSQASVIALVDRMMGPRPGSRLTLAGRGARWQMATVRAVFDDPADMIDQTYSLASDFLALHQNFALRLLEALDRTDDANGLDANDLDACLDRGAAKVVPMVHRRPIRV